MLKIAQLGQPVLRQRAAEVPVEEIRSAEFQQFLREMRLTLEGARGVGLAAPQIFSSRRVFLAQVLPPLMEEGRRRLEVFINPRLTMLSTKKNKAWEGCLSFQELLVLVPRHLALRIDYFDGHGQARTLSLVDFPARVVQHENDHLDGILTIDRAESTLDIIKESEIVTVLGDDDEE